jgi:hypothetical protein
MYTTLNTLAATMANGETLIVVGLKSGPHKVLVELADPTHRVIDHQTVSFVVPPMPGEHR